MEKIVHIVDDDPDVRKALARLLSSAGHKVSAHQSAYDFLRAYDPMISACIILDIAMPEISGLELQAQLKTRHITCPVIFLTGRGDIPDCVQAMKEGAIDFLTKPVEINDLLDAVALGLAKNDVAQQNESLLATLTPREREIVPHLITGRRNKQIAAELGITEKTIKVHRARVLHKLGMRTTIELLGFLERAGHRQ